MTDIVDELRNDFNDERKDFYSGEVIAAYEEERHRAADEIESLRARVANLESQVKRAKEAELLKHYPRFRA